MKKHACLGRYLGFTLIELLVVTAISGVIVSIIAACLIGGMRVWDRSRTFNDIEAESVIGLGIVEKDLMNSIGFFDISFQGKEDAMSFCGLSAAPREASDEDQTTDERIGTIKYTFDSGASVLLRKTWVFPAEEPEQQGEKIISGASSIAFQYYRAPEAGISGEWISQWTEETNWPDRVKIDATFIRDDSRVNISRTVLMPVKRRAGEK